MIELPITPRARTYGYIFWQKKMEDEIISAFKGKETVTVMLNTKNIGEKSVSYKYRRLSLGPTVLSREIPEDHTIFCIKLRGSTLSVSTK